MLTLRGPLSESPVGEIVGTEGLDEVLVSDVQQL